VHYYFQLAQQHQAALQQTAQQSGSSTQTAAAIPTIQIVQPATGQVQTVSIANPAVEQVFKFHELDILFMYAKYEEFFPFECLLSHYIISLCDTQL
jgi:hypothetical protein